MGNLCSRAPEPQTSLWEFINPTKEKYGLLLSVKGVSRWHITFANNVFTIYDNKNDVSAKAVVSDSTDDGFTLTATFNYVVRQTVYATPTAIKPRTLSFTFSLKDNIKHNLRTYGWRTIVNIYDNGHLIEHCGLV